VGVGVARRPVRSSLGPCQRVPRRRRRRRAAERVGRGVERGRSWRSLSLLSLSPSTPFNPSPARVPRLPLPPSYHAVPARVRPSSDHHQRGCRPSGPRRRPGRRQAGEFFVCLSQPRARLAFTRPSPRPRMSRIVVGGERASYMPKIACSRPPSHPARGALGEAQCIYWPSFALPAAAAAAHRRSRPSLSLSLHTQPTGPRRRRHPGRRRVHPGRPRRAGRDRSDDARRGELEREPEGRLRACRRPPRTGSGSRLCCSLARARVGGGRGVPMPCTVCLACSLPCRPGRAGGRNAAPNRSPHASPQIGGARAPRERRSLHLNHSLSSLHPSTHRASPSSSPWAGPPPAPCSPSPWPWSSGAAPVCRVVCEKWRGGQGGAGEGRGVRTARTPLSASFALLGGGAAIKF